MQLPPVSPIVVSPAPVVVVTVQPPTASLTGRVKEFISGMWNSIASTGRSYYASFLARSTPEKIAIVVGGLLVVAAAVKAVQHYRNRQNAPQPAPVNPEPALPLNPDPALPLNPEPALPLNPEPALPLNPDPALPLNPEPALPLNPEPALPLNPEPALPLNPVDDAPVVTIRPSQPPVRENLAPLGSGVNQSEVIILAPSGPHLNGMTHQETFSSDPSTPPAAELVLPIYREASRESEVRSEDSVSTPEASSSSSSSSLERTVMYISESPAHAASTSTVLTATTTTTSTITSSE